MSTSSPGLFVIPNMTKGPGDEVGHVSLQKIGLNWAELGGRSLGTWLVFLSLLLVLLRIIQIISGGGILLCCWYRNICWGAFSQLQDYVYDFQISSGIISIALKHLVIFSPTLRKICKV